jgi:hypothetical protein
MNDHTASRNSAAYQGSVVWYISLGDLLTLLVCFFFVLTPWQRPGKAQQHQTNQAVVNQSDAVSGAGIDLASARSSGRESVLAEVPIFRCAAQGKPECLNELARALEGEAQKLRRPAETIAIRLCDRTVAKGGLPELAVSVLNRTHVKGTPVSIELRGEGCERFELLRPVTADAVGAVRMM